MHKHKDTTQIIISEGSDPNEITIVELGKNNAITAMEARLKTDSGVQSLRRVEVYPGDGPTMREKKDTLYTLRNVPQSQNPLGYLGVYKGYSDIPTVPPENDPIGAMYNFSRAIEKGEDPSPDTLKWLAGIFDKFRISYNYGARYSLDELFDVAGNKRLREFVYKKRDRLISRDFFLLKNLFNMKAEAAKDPILAKSEMGAYIERSDFYRDPKATKTNKTPKPIANTLDGRALTTAGSKYSEYWENHFFINPSDIPTPQDFLDTFPESGIFSIRHFLNKANNH